MQERLEVAVALPLGRVRYLGCDLLVVHRAIDGAEDPEGSRPDGVVRESRERERNARLDV